MIRKIYKWLYTHLTPWIKRPWTFAMRDFAYQNPMLMLFIGFGLGMGLDRYVSWDDLWILFAGILLAHLFWGTKWRKGQKE